MPLFSDEQWKIVHEYDDWADYAQNYEQSDWLREQKIVKQRVLFKLCMNIAKELNPANLQLLKAQILLQILSQTQQQQIQQLSNDQN